MATMKTQQNLEYNIRDEFIVGAVGLYFLRYLIEPIVFVVNRSPWAQNVIKKTLSSLGYNVDSNAQRVNVQQDDGVTVAVKQVD